MRKRREASAKEMSTRLYANRVFVTVRPEIASYHAHYESIVGMDC